MEKKKALRSQLQEALVECERLRKENETLRRLIRDLPDKATVFPEPRLADTPQRAAPTPETISSLLSPETKVTLFRGLFCGRDDVYALRWENKSGRHGYSPAGKRDVHFYNHMLKSQAADKRN